MTKKEIVESDDNTILKLRVERSVVRDFPFDVFYLVPFSQKAILPKIFPWSLCLPPHKTFTGFVQRLWVYEIETLPFKGRREIQHQSVNGRQVDYTPENISERFILVPILPLVTDPEDTFWQLRSRFFGKDEARDVEKEKAKAKAKRAPYLVAPRHAKPTKRNQDLRIDVKTESRFSWLLTDDAVLFTPDGPVRPVCMACSRHMLHVLGKCQLGCQLCFEELILRRAPDEQLPKNGADAPANS